MRMRAFDERDWIYRVSGVDNGTSLLGFATLDLDLRTKVATVLDAHTYDAEAAYDEFSGLMNNRSPLKARCRIVREYSHDYAERFDPDAFGIESPFQHQHPQAFGALTLSMDSVDDGVYRYRQGLPFVKVAPGRAKRAVALPDEGKPYSTKKEVIREYILTHPRIIAVDGLDLHSLGPDAIDAISVAYYMATLAFDSAV